MRSVTFMFGVFLFILMALTPSGCQYITHEGPEWMRGPQTLEEKKLKEDLGIHLTAALLMLIAGGGGGLAITVALFPEEKK